MSFLLVVTNKWVLLYENNKRSIINLSLKIDSFNEWGLVF